jgi:flagellar biosynthesis GTPase FlhF
MALVERALGPDARIVATETSARSVRILAAPSAIVAIPRPDETWTTPALEFGISRDRLSRLSRMLPRAAGIARAVEAAAVLAHWLRCDSHWPSRRIVIVGPNGAGKTTSVVKLAAHATRHGDAARLRTLDGGRPGGIAQLTELAANLQLPILPTPTVTPPAGPSPAIEFIDTPGIAPTDHAAASSLVRDPHCARGSLVLALPADLRRADAEAHVDLWQPLGLSRVILTKWDVARRPGELLDLAIERGLTLGFVTNGRSVPADLVVADPIAMAMLALDLAESDLDAVAARWRSLQVSRDTRQSRRSTHHPTAS